MKVCPRPENSNEWIEIDEAFAIRLQPLREYLEGEDVLVRALPDVAAGFGERTDSGDLYFVISQGEANRDERTKQLISETWQLTLVIMLPNRYSKSGVYDVFKRARNLLVGYDPPYAMTAVSAPDWKFNRDEAHWVIQATFPFDVYIVDAVPVDNTPAITRMSIQIEGSNYVEVVDAN